MELLLLALVGGGLYLYYQTSSGKSPGSPGQANLPQININVGSNGAGKPTTSDGGSPLSKALGGGAGGGGPGGFGGFGQQQSADASMHPGAEYPNSIFGGETLYEASGAGTKLTEPVFGSDLPGAPGSIDSNEGQVGAALNPGTLALDPSYDAAANTWATGNNYQLTEPSLGSSGWPSTTAESAYDPAASPYGANSGFGDPVPASDYSDSSGEYGVEDPATADWGF